MVKALILAAGRGSRLGELTDDKPKGFVMINKKSLLERTIENFNSSSIQEFGIVGGYKYQQLAALTNNLFINNEWASTSIFSSLNCADEWLSNYECIVSYSDIFYSQNILQQIIDSTNDINIAYDPNAVKLWQERFANPLLDLETFQIDKNNQIYEIGNRAPSLEYIEGQFMGVFKTTPLGWKQLKETWATTGFDKNMDVTSMFNLALKLGVKLYGVANQDPWGEVDHPSDIKLYEGLLNEHI